MPEKLNDFQIRQRKRWSYIGAFFAACLLIAVVMLPYNERKLARDRITFHGAPGGVVNPRLNTWQSLPLPEGTGDIEVVAQGRIKHFDISATAAGVSQKPPRGTTLVDDDYLWMGLLIRACRGYGTHNNRCSPARIFIPGDSPDTARIHLFSNWIANADHVEVIVNHPTEYGRTDYFGQTEGSFKVTLRRVDK